MAKQKNKAKKPISKAMSSPVSKSHSTLPKPSIGKRKIKQRTKSKSTANQWTVIEMKTPPKLMGAVGNEEKEEDDDAGHEMDKQSDADSGSFISDSELREALMAEEDSGDETEKIITSSSDDERDKALDPNIAEKLRKNKRLAEIYKDMQLDELVAKKNETKGQVKDMPSNGSNKNQVEVVEFQDPLKVRRQRALENEQKRKEMGQDEDEYDDEELPDAKTLTHEIFRFAVKGMMAGEEKMEAKKALALSLGAKLPRQKPINYKEKMKQVQEQKKKEREEKKLAAQTKGVGPVKVFSIASNNLSLKRMYRNKNKKKRGLIRKPNDIRGMKYQAGQFKDGVLRVNKRSLK